MNGSVPPPPEVCPGFIYTVQPGDTLFNIAGRFSISLSNLIAANPQIPDPNLIFPGQMICIPTPVPPFPTVECCMLLFRINVPILPDAEAGGVARVFQAPPRLGNLLVSTIGLPPPQTLGGNIYVAWIRRPPLPPVPIQLLQTGPVKVEPGVWVGAVIFEPAAQFVPFQDIVVTAEIAFPVFEPNLSRIVLIGLFELCRPQ